MTARMFHEASVIILSMRVFELGEFGLINLIRSNISTYEDLRHTIWQEVIVGIGDDAAAWQSDNYIHLATGYTLQPQCY
jgi:hypothetical protein